MNRLSRAALVFACAVLLASCSSKSDTTGSEEASTDEVNTERKSLVNPPIQLAEGIDADPKADQGTGNQCVSHDFELTEPHIRTLELSTHDQIDEGKYNEPFHRFFWMNDRDDLGRMMTIIAEAEDGDGLLDFLEFSKVAELHYDRVFAETEGPVLSALVVIPSADLNATDVGEASTPGSCVKNSGSPISPQPTNLAEWVEDCGVRYLAEEKRGYYFFLSSDSRKSGRSIRYGERSGLGRSRANISDRKLRQSDTSRRAEIVGDRVTFASGTKDATTAPA